MGLDRIKDIKERVSVLEYARDVLGLPVRRSGDRCVSLAPGSTNPTALLIQTNHWYDFKLGMGGDVIDLCAYARHNGDKGAAIRELGGVDDGWLAYTQNLCNGVEKWHKDLREEDWKYLRSRGLTDDTVKRLKIGFDGDRLVIPYFKNGYVAYVATRTLTGEEPKYKKMFLDGINENIPWGLHTLTREKNPLCITEGAFDAIAFEQEGYKVLSPISGYFAPSAMKQAVNICQAQDSVFLCFDGDGAGSRFQMKMAQTCFENKINFTCGTLPSGVKDVSDYYAAGGSLQALISAAEAGADVLCCNIRGREEFKTFIFKAARFVDKPTIVELLENPFLDFSASWLKEVKKQALSAPPEDLIVKEMEAERRLKYSEALGFYEYGGGVWKPRGDTEVKAYIAGAFGHYRSGSRVNSTLALLKAETVSTEMFNRQDVFNFHNCVLDLATGEAKEHSEAFMSSIQVGYNYIPEARSAAWMEFLDSVCQGDEAAMNLLQEIAGYVLFADNSLQKCFFLMGDGANGKSVFLDVLTALFGEKNVSNIEMSGLVEPFQRIHLLNSIVNISAETRSDVKGSESVFKQVVVGDAINGCYKNKDFITFRPRTKLIIACNNHILSRDTSTGFLRRICFVKFNAKYSDAPQKGELKADKNLTAKLIKDLPGIFNWAYAGYKILKETKTFTETAAEREMMGDFVKTINPMIAFIEEGDWTKSVERGALYTQYVQWSKDSGHQPMSRTRFIQQFKQAAKQAKLNFREKMIHGYRYFDFADFLNDS